MILLTLPTLSQQKIVLLPVKNTRSSYYKDGQKITSILIKNSNLRDVKV